MHVMKPMKVGFLHRMFSYRRDYYFGVEALLCTSFDGEGLASEIGMWKFLGEELAGMPVDEALPKPRGEFLVKASAWAPGGQPTRTLPVSATVGPVKKTLYVIGDRRWERGTPTEAVPFTSMPVTWDRAFGGAGYELNPGGRGAAPVPLEDGSAVHPLPNVEREGRLVSSPSERPKPGGFMPIELTSPLRMKKAGTYDQRWIEESFPGYADDIDWTIFNTASPDQWAPAFWAPDTSFSFRNMHPELPTVEGRLPGLVARAFLVRGKSPKAEQDWREVKLDLSTLWFFPAHRKVVLGFTGALKVLEDDGSDVDWVLLAAEHAGRPKPEAHYRRVMLERDGFEADALLASFRDSDLLPEGIRPDLEEALEHADVAESEQLARRNAIRGAMEDWEKGRALCVESGLDPDEIVGPCPFTEEDLGPPKKLGIEAALKLAMEQRKEAEAQLEEAKAEKGRREEEIRRLAAEAGVDVDAELERARAQVPTGVPIQSAAEVLASRREAAAKLRAHGMPDLALEAQLADPAYLAQLGELEAKQVEAYRAGAHLGDESMAGIPRPEALAAMRAQIERVLATTRNFAGADLTGADLSGLDLSGARFAGAFLEHANLERTRCRDTDFRRAVLVRTRWRDAELARTQLDDANLGRADLAGARVLEPLSLSGAILEHTNLSGLSLAGSRLESVTLGDATLRNVDLSGVHAPGLVLRGVKLRDVNLDGAQLEGAELSRCDLARVSLRGAVLSRTSFDGTRGHRCDFSGARADGVRLTQESAFVECDFAECLLEDAYLREARLDRSRFDGAVLDRADLCGASLLEARFVGARGRHVRMTRAKLDGADLSRADLMYAALDKASLPGTRLREANLYFADFGLVLSDGSTDVSGANTTHVKVHPKRKTP